VSGDELPLPFSFLAQTLALSDLSFSLFLSSPLLSRRRLDP